MTEATTSSRTLDSAEDRPVHPEEILIHLIVTLLTPMFIAAADGDIALARLAALETINAYRAKDQASQLLAALGSLGLSMADDLPIPMILRLRANANALNRSAERAERALDKTRPGRAPASGLSEPEGMFDEAAMPASLAEVQGGVAEARERAPAETPPTGRAPIPASVPTMGKDPSLQAFWAAAMADVATEDMAAVVNLPRAARQEATARATVLGGTVNALLSGVPMAKAASLDDMIRPYRRP